MRTSCALMLFGLLSWLPDATAWAGGMEPSVGNAVPSGVGLVQDRLNRLSMLVGAAEPVKLLVVAASSPDDGSVSEGRLMLSQSTIASAADVRELDGLLATMVAFGVQRPGNDDRAPATSFGKAAGALAIVAGSALDRNYSPIPTEDARPEDVTRDRGSGVGDAAADHGRALMALRLASRMGSCSGPTVTVLTRLARPRPTLEKATVSHVSLIAGRALANFGAAVYPPDFSCVR